MSVIKINPAVMSDKRDATATAWNEGLRLWMEDNGFEPQFEFTPEQQTFFAKTAYSQDASAMRKTIVARIATRDTSVPNPTPDQISETARLLSEVGDSIGKFNKDAGVVSALARDLQARAPAPEEVEEPEAPETEGTEQMAQGAGDVQEVDLLNNQMLARSLTETEGRYVGGYMDSASKSKPGVLTVGEGLTYVTDEKGVRAPVTKEWLAQFKDKDELDKALQTQNARFLLGVQKKLEPKLSQMDPATQALVANVAFNRGEAKASEYADMILAVPMEKRHGEALSRLAIAGTPRGKAKGTIGIAKGRYEHLVENLVSPEKAVAYGEKWKDPKFREEVVAKTEAGTAAYVGRTHDKWAAKTRPTDFAKLSAINAKFKI